MPEIDNTIAATEADFAKLIANTRSLMLATAGKSPTPESSYVPYIRDEQGAFYIFVSEMARHTINLRGGNPASIMIIEDEADAVQIFARRRATFTCQPEEIARDSEECTMRLDAFRARFGGMIDTLAGMSDFHLIKLTPTSGRVVLGFAAAFRVTGDNWDQLEQRVATGAKGHR
ncbi:HugZ family protein [Cerasicoccus arenae]|uniref:Heme utilization protein HutZ n=1 Tax=Cerasicoccus arenae TaxID=424488 RepID=A0A8J3DIU3_9BACT|nr:pyridoxamine 5'-phosphate oxidase family protein [Cerasicoccus arenae]MBK1859785.1 pyridoxamine 5'-phosphate oxidase family protein [Cerasicoccus arenae]GHC13151.1 heme utilization protein HutZ [Cerasicoccus arenae]